MRNHKSNIFLIGKKRKGKKDGAAKYFEIEAEEDSEEYSDLDDDEREIHGREGQYYHEKDL